MSMPKSMTSGHGGTTTALYPVTSIVIITATTAAMIKHARGAEASFHFYDFRPSPEWTGRVAHSVDGTDKTPRFIMPSFLCTTAQQFTPEDVVPSHLGKQHECA
jgi:hypothetical protein